MNKILYYYGVEADQIKNQQDKEYNLRASFSGQIPENSHYTKGLFAYKLKDGENEAEIKKQIEQRCKNNPNGSMVCGITTAHFYWVDK